MKLLFLLRCRLSRNSDIATVAAHLSRAVNERVQLPDEFLFTVKHWMGARQKTHTAESQMQLAHLIGMKASEMDGDLHLGRHVEWQGS